MDTSWQVACLIRTENKYYINKKQDQIRLERSRSCSWFLDSNEHENVGWNTFVPVGPKKLFSSTQKRFQTWPSDWCRKSVASRSSTYFFLSEKTLNLFTGVSCEKLQDADADGHPLGWRRKKQHFELNELLLWFRVLRWRGRWLEDATFLSFWRHGATMPSFDVLLLLIFVQVNIAALMESTSEPMKIQISQTTQENFQFKKHD